MPQWKQYSGIWTSTQQAQAVAAETWTGIPQYELYTWGNNAYGQLGQDTVTIESSSPVQVGADVDWGKISSGNYHTVSVKTDGTLWTWGVGTSGETGHNDAINSSSPVQVGTLTNWSHVTAGAYFNLAIKTDGTLWTWGANSSGQLGDGTTVKRSSPVQIGSGTDWYQTSGGQFHSAAIKTDGTLWTWGDNSNGELGQNIASVTDKSSPVQVGALTDWAQVSAGRAAAGWTMAVKTDGTIWAWGGQANGRLGNNDGLAINYSSPIQIGALTNWSKVSAGNLHCAAIKTNFSLWTWGWGSTGATGQNNALITSSPIQVGATNTWAQVASGSTHTASIRTNGTLWTWGDNADGRLGQNTPELLDRSSPVQVGALSTWFEVAVGNYNTAAINQTTT